MKNNKEINVDARIEFDFKGNRWKLLLFILSPTKRAVICFNNARFSATTERPESGDYELVVVQAEVAEKLETELTKAHARENKLRNVIMDCERQVAELRAQSEADRREIAILTSDRNGLMEANKNHRDALAAAQQRIKELEADGRVLQEKPDAHLPND